MNNKLFEEKNRTILCYPTMALTENQWTKQALLYWDEISSIVPMRYDSDQDKEVPVIPFTPDVEFLLNKKVFRQIDPSKFSRLEDLFLQFKLSHDDAWLETGKAGNLAASGNK